MTVEQAIRQAWPKGIAKSAVNSISQVVEVGTQTRGLWFRGQSRCFSPLIPAILREPYHSARKNIGFWAAERFRLRARAFTDLTPSWNDHLAWLLLMQHHGVPTSLLDWTESILVALYFAVQDGTADEDGEIWCIRPSTLNNVAFRHLCGPDDEPIKYLAARTFLDEPALEKCRKSLGLDKVPMSPLGFVPPKQFPRLRTQFGCFTIHPSGKPEHLIEFLLREEEHLFCYVIPRGKKKQLKRELTSLGISREVLFNDLDSLAACIKEEILEKDFPLHRPPTFNC